MKDRWYQLLLNKINNSYSHLIIVVDYDNLGQVREITEELQGKFAVHHYRREWSLRAFLGKKRLGERTIIFRPGDCDYLPYDIEEKAELISWKLQELFPKLAVSAVKKQPPEHYQQIYNCYREVEHLIAPSGEKETLEMITTWLQDLYRKPGSGSHQGEITAGATRETGAELTTVFEETVKKLQGLLQEEPVDWRRVGLLWGQLAYLQDLDNVAIPSQIEARVFPGFEQFIYQQSLTLRKQYFPLSSLKM